MLKGTLKVPMKVFWMENSKVLWLEVLMVLKMDFQSVLS